MKSSNDNTPLLVGLFVLAAIIIALIVYYTRPGETKTSEQTSDTTELTVENLTLSRTLNPDPSVSSGTSGYTIEPYGIEYATGATGDVQYKALSKNVTFTMNWTNSPGFTDVVKGFKIKHYVKATGATSYPTNANQTLLKKTTAVSPETISISDFGACTAKIVSIATGDNAYSVIGQNSFKLYAVVQEVDKTFDWGTSNTQKDVLLYDGTAETTEPPELKISKDQLSVTLIMTSAETISYTPESITSTTTSTIIEKDPYKITNNTATLNIERKGVYLTLIPDTMGKHFNFTYEDGDYLRDDLTKGPVTTTNGKTKFKFEIVDKEGSVGKIRKVGTTTTTDSNSEFLSSDGTTLKLYTKTHQDLNATRFAGFNWTFVDWEPVNCVGTYLGWSPCSNQCGTGERTKEYDIEQQPNDMGEPCKPNLTEVCSSYAGCAPVNCEGTFDSNFGACIAGDGKQAKCEAGTKTKKFNITQQPNSTGEPCPPPSTKSCIDYDCGGRGGVPFQG